MLSLLQQGWWQGVSAIGTLLLALATFFTIMFHIYRDKREKADEIAEEVLIPMLNSITDMRRELRKFSPNFLRWQLSIIKSQKAHLYYRLPKEVKQILESLDKDITNIKNLKKQVDNPTIQDKSFVEVISGKLREFSTDQYKDNNLVSESNWQVNVAGNVKTIEFFDLIMHDGHMDWVATSYALDQAKMTQELLGGHAIKDVNFYIPGSKEINREEFKEAIDFALETIKDNKEFKNYIDKRREISDRIIKIEKIIKSKLEDFNDLTYVWKNF